jgi:hypothetical protein
MVLPASPDRSFDWVYVGHLPRGLSDLALREAFGAAGIRVRDIEVVLDRSTGLSRGFAFVRLCERIDADASASSLARMCAAGPDDHPFDVRAIPSRRPDDRARGPRTTGTG